MINFTWNLYKIGWDSVTPPELSTDAPVLDVLKPSEPCLLFAFWNDCQFLASDSFTSSSCHIFAIDIPLWFQVRFDDVSSLCACSDPHSIWLLFSQKAFFLESFSNSFSGIKSHHALEFSSNMVDATIFIEDINELKIVTFTALVIIWIVGWSNLHSTSSKVHVN